MDKLTLIREELAYKDNLTINPFKIGLFKSYLTNNYIVKVTSPSGKTISSIKTKNCPYAWNIMYKIEARYNGYKSANLELLESMKGAN